MKFTRLYTFILAILVAQSSAIKPKVSVWSSDSEKANGTQLVQCVVDIEKLLHAHPQVTRNYGYRCGNSWFQYGSDRGFKPGKTHYLMFQKCKLHLDYAASAGKDWFLCKVQGGGWGNRIVAYSPLGFYACDDGGPLDHSPCRKMPGECRGRPSDDLSCQKVPGEGQ
ncbi:hypothetical protein CBER1_08729 [Cercospora berteroae]|uniref:Cyanovirin-N domain-containing protein n=1 Tax=Cercospora berteroae TaxID=357750 RepID=A0A2S6CAH9_9PEZI|nr:hypothetical protein CBER1_08729 [Cercospora berteroae]